MMIMMMMRNLTVLLGIFYPTIIFGLDVLPERARHGHAQKLFDSINPSAVGNALSKTWSAKVDNFDESNTDTYQQRFYVNDVYWQGNGPVFLYIGGEGTLNGPPGGYVSYLGKQYSALLISVEHRFYGESIPYGNATTENYKYLTVEQALADLAGFTAFYKSIVPETADVKWVAFGGSYPGALSSWYRSAYPSLTVGSLSSSGVVYCIVDYQGFDMQVSAAVGNECTGSIRRVQQAFKKTIEQPGVSGWQLAKSLFACEADISQTDFYYMIADSWSMAVQYSSKLSLCSALAAVDETDPSPEQDLKAMQTFAAFSNNYWGSDFCSQGFYNTKALADPARWDLNSRSWRYQTCAQVSYFNTAPVSGSLRDTSVDLNYHLTQCAKIFGEKMFPASAKMNEKFGGQFPKASKVFYTDFSDDPWQRASVTFPPSADQPYYLSTCEECGHCKDLSTPQQSDPAPLKTSRAEFEKYLAQWLK